MQPNNKTLFMVGEESLTYLKEINNMFYTGGQLMFHLLNVLKQVQ